jgi:hypothetical protein
MPSNYVLLERIELNATTSSVTFANIPQTGYTDLKLVASARQSTAAIAADVTVQFNGTAANNFNRFIYGDSASAGSGTDGYGPSRNYFSIGVANTATANTFSNVEMYIPNYTSSNNKSFTVESVGENNGTSSVFQLMVAGLWSNSAAINQITLTPVLLESFLANSTFSLYGVAAVGTTPAIAPKASGGNIQTDGTYWYHTFLSSGTFTPATSLSCDYLVVAGGGAGAPPSGTASGGGGAGGYRTSIGGSPLSLTATAYTVTVGAGGAGTTSTTTVSNGSNSVFSTITSTGGGGSGIATGTPVNAGNGGSGGGGSAYYTNNKGLGNTPSTSPSQGNDGGNGVNLNINASGGGGGAGAAGGNGSGSNAGAGGAGSNSASSWASATGTGVSGYYAGGGGGGSEVSGAAAGGAGGGGAGSNEGKGTDGTANTGGGGGGSGNPMTGNAASGGSGIVIIRYTVA